MVIGPLLVLGIASVASVETTGKGLADHTISAVRDQDCKIVRGLRGEDVCQPTAPTARVTVAPAPATTEISSVKAMEDVFAQRRARFDQKIQK